MVGFGLDYACAHIIIPASVNLLPIQADFVTERYGGPLVHSDVKRTAQERANFFFGRTSSFSRTRVS